MKKLIIAILMVIMAFALTGCDSHEYSTTTMGTDSYGSTYTIISE